MLLSVNDRLAGIRGAASGPGAIVPDLEKESPRLAAPCHATKIADCRPRNAAAASGRRAARKPARVLVIGLSFQLHKSQCRNRYQRRSHRRWNAGYETIIPDRWLSGEFRCDIRPSVKLAPMTGREDCDAHYALRSPALPPAFRGARFRRRPACAATRRVLPGAASADRAIRLDTPRLRDVDQQFFIDFICYRGD